MKILIVKFPYDEPGFSERFVEKICTAAEKLAYDIVGIMSLDINETCTTVGGYPVCSADDIQNFSWNVAVLACDEEVAGDIIPRMVELGIGRREQFQNQWWLLKQLMTQKYEDVRDPDIQATLAFWRTNKLSVFNQHIDDNAGTGNRVFFDDPCGLPYIFFKTDGGEWRKMFFPRDFEFTEKNGEKFVLDILREQLPTSPHLYIKGDHKVNAGDILIDAGVCEGNFSLRYVDICSKIYLFEPDAMWHEPLAQTFRDYRDKVEIIPRFVSDVTDGDNITIDDALPDLRGQKIFLKMDIEGAEPKALRGAKRILTNNFVKASVCSYHNADDCVRIKGIFRKLGYRVSTSDGWMVFTIDPKIFDTADFRKGIVYAENY